MKDHANVYVSNRLVTEVRVSVISSTVSSCASVTLSLLLIHQYRPILTRAGVGVSHLPWYRRRHRRGRHLGGVLRFLFSLFRIRQGLTVSFGRFSRLGGVGLFCFLLSLLILRLLLLLLWI